MYTHDIEYETAQLIVVGATEDGPAIDFARNADKPGCVCALIKYTPGEAVRTLTIVLEVKSSDAALTTDWYTFLTEGTVDIIGAGAAVDSFTAIILALPGGISSFRLTFSSAGGAGADDEITVVLTGMPDSGVTVTP